MEKKTWKTLAIIFGIIMVLETVAFSWMFIVGSDIVEKETECLVNVCSEAETYYYDSYEEICYCFMGDDIVKQQFMR